MTWSSRRRLLRAVGVAGSLGLAGCRTDDGSGTTSVGGTVHETDGTDAGPKAVVRKWLLADSISEVNEVAHPRGDAYIQSPEETNPYFQQERSVHEVDRRSPAAVAADTGQSPSDVRARLDAIREEFDTEETALVYVSATRGAESQPYETYIVVVRADGEWLVLGE
ncbi:hypothetical protein ACOZ4N_19645 [Halorientalis pallida]|uniref:hypothetical protein n=1 Tax=Halorientalis pallida TaxID=2479928 RepID=UPI003C6F7212